jgi:carboxypeptidase T
MTLGRRAVDSVDAQSMRSPRRNFESPCEKPRRGPVKSFKKIFPLFVLFVLLVNPFQHGQTIDTTQYLLKVKAKDKFERNVIANTGAAIEGVREGYVFAIANLEEKKQLEDLGWVLESKNLAHVLDFPPKDADYHNYAEVVAELKKLNEEFPEMTRLFSIGKSLEGREIMGIRICGDMENASQLPGMALMGGHHSREHLSVEVPLRYARFFLERYRAGDFRIRGLIFKRDLQIVPAVNPDGLEFDVATASYKMWRKNRRKNGNGTYGVDLNRNYGYKWGTGGSSTNPNSDTYMGVAPFSEPETQAVKSWIEGNKNINVLLSMHTFSELVLYPWGHSNDPIADQRARAVHETMARKIAGWNHYKPEQSSDLYIASGDTTDWAFGQHGIISFTFELDPKSQLGGSAGFYPGAGIIPEVLEKNKEPLLYLLEYADDPYRVLAKGSSVPDRS